MPLPIPRIPIFVTLLDALPIKVADWLVFLESDVAESLVIQAFGQRIILPIKPSGMEEGGARELIFEGSIPRPIVEVPNVCTLSVPEIRIALRSSNSSFTVDTLSVDVSGRSTFELHVPGIFGTNSIRLEGQMHLTTQIGLVLKTLRFDFEDALCSLPLPGGISLTIRPSYLDFSLRDDGSPHIEMEVTCRLEGLAPRIQDALGQTSFQAHIRWSKEGTTIASTSVYEGLTIPLPSFPAFGGSEPWNLGEMTVAAKYLRINIDRNIECSLDISVGIPLILHDVMEPRIDFRLSSVNDQVRIELLSSPFRSANCFRVPNGNLRAKVRVGEGKITFDIPSLRIDWAGRRFLAEGHISHQNIRIPVAPLRPLLERAGLQSLAKRLPDSIPLQSFGLTGISAAFSDLLEAAFQDGLLAGRGRDVLEKAFKVLHHLPPRLQDEFLRVHVPKEIAFRFECSFDFDARLFLAPSNDPIRAEAAPIRLLVPFLGAHGPELLGIKLYRWAFGELHAGQAFTVEIDAEVESFELLSGGGFAAANATPSHLVLRDVVALVGQTSGVPWIMPLSFRKIGWHHVGFDGMSSAFQCELSLPKIDFRTLLHGLVPGASAADANEWLKAGQIECRVAPAYFRFPDALGGKEFGSRDEVIALRTPERIQRLLRAWQTVDKDEFLTVIFP